MASLTLICMFSSSVISLLCINTHKSLITWVFCKHLPHHMCVDGLSHYMSGFVTRLFIKYKDNLVKMQNFILVREVHVLCIN